jgi:hypothetical protein
MAYSQIYYSIQTRCQVMTRTHEAEERVTYATIEDIFKRFSPLVRSEAIWLDRPSPVQLYVHLTKGQAYS